ncbi:hypothetical protein D3C85_1656420 [compost metagenome]
MDQRSCSFSNHASRISDRPIVGIRNISDGGYFFALMKLMKVRSESPVWTQGFSP